MTSTSRVPPILVNPHCGYPLMAAQVENALLSFLQPSDDILEWLEPHELLETTKPQSADHGSRVSGSTETEARKKRFLAVVTHKDETGEYDEGRCAWKWCQMYPRRCS